MNRRSRTVRLAAGLTAVVTAGLIAAAFPSVATASARDGAPTLVVRPGESIQAAIDAAAPGATVLVRRGVYRENLFIDHPLTLRGQGGVLVEPPTVQTPNVCTESRPGTPGEPLVTWGVCITGELGPPDPEGVPTVVTPVSDVTISNIHVRGFVEGLGALGTQRLTFDRLEIDRQGDAGINIVRSTDATIERSFLHDNHDFAIKVSLGDGIRVRGNRIIDTSDANGTGLNVSQYRDVLVRGNEVAGNCTGIILVDVVVAGTMRDAVVERNHVHRNSRYCPGEGIPSASGNGILLGGVANARVSHNKVVRNVPSPDPATGAPAELALGGIAIFDSTPFGGSAPTNNLVTRNTARHNRPYDISSDDSGSNNVLRNNRCRTTNVPSACKRTP